MSQNLRNQGMLILGGCTALLIFLATAAQCQSTGKIPRDVIDATAANGSAWVLVGLDVPWQMEASLSQGDLRAQRSAIASGQNDLLDHLAGREFTVVRRYQEIPGIALEVGAEALAELARPPIVTNVLLDRPAGSAIPAKQSALPPAASGFHTYRQRKSAVHFSPARHATAPCSCLPGYERPWQREDRLERKTGRFATTRDP